MPRTLYEKLVDQHVVATIDDSHVLLYVDFHVMNEYTSPQAFAGLHSAHRPVRRPRAHLAVVDHVNPTRPITDLSQIEDAGGRLQIETLSANCARHGIQLFDLFDPRQGIEHVVVPENGFAWPGMVIACGDSHTTTYGAFGALAFGIGTSEIEHVLATQTLVYKVLKPMQVRIDGALPTGTSAKDIVMAFVERVGAAGASGFAVEFTGTTIDALSVEARMTLCNMAVEAGARAALIAPDQKVFDDLAGRPQAPKGAALADALRDWQDLRSDPDAAFARVVEIDTRAIAPLVTWGTSPDQSAPITARIPAPQGAGDQRALDYMGLDAGQPLDSIAIDRAFIGSCTNARIEDLRRAAAILDGRTVADGVTAIVVPGSKQVRAMAEAEGLDAIFKAAGFDWRGAGCSMCLAMNDDVAASGERCASSTNRNFEGRQGRGARTHLMSPEMVAAAAVTGTLTDVRTLMKATP
ncbi:3-isopropylmalate dehydratase large subunit [uncultured Tateyamaria sp.]|uniref:3-isopropylmalate dehydratase large subunit n=1 Tax=Tateyamaria sp. 1078 TaxID=3417464 RepID=UPI0026199CF7|nr:3-isopropylmalate dehydratase large subunit [uncultured Tateyamaria sp.]